MKLKYIILITILLSFTLPTFAQEDNTHDDDNNDSFYYGSPDVGAPLQLHLRTNLLYDAILVPNIGVELGKSESRWSFIAQGGGNWMSAKNKNRYWRITYGELEARYWLRNPFYDMQHSGHHFGIYLLAGRYDIEFGGKGQLSDFQMGGGLSYGYTAPLGRHFALDFGLAVGYLGGEYKKYEPIDDHYVWTGNKQRNYFGPIKAEVTLVWHIELRKKGGLQW